MKYLRTSFRAGQVVTESTGRLRFRKELTLGNGWRGMMVAAGIFLLIKNIWELGFIVLGLAGLWSWIELALKNWRKVVSQEKTFLLLEQGKFKEALDINGIPEPGCYLWWRILAQFFKQQQWQHAAEWLKELAEGNERNYLLALARIAGNQPKQALLLCPSKADDKWLTVKAEALFQMKEWEQVLALLRRSGPWRATGSQDLEKLWLKGSSYYFLRRYKSALRLLEYVNRRGGADYGSTAKWLRDAEAKLKEV